MSKETPSVLYKYYPIDTAMKYLANEMVRFSQAGVLNDHYEFVQKIEFIVEADFGRELVEGVLQRQNVVIDRIRRAYGDAVINDTVKKHIELKNNPCEIDAIKRRALAVLLKHVNNSIGILSLTANGDSNHMWKQYAGNGNGVCIGFDVNHEWFRKQNGNGLALDKIMPVEYGEIPILKLKPSLNAVGPLDKQWFFSKTNEWLVEEEWRIVKLLNHCDKKLPIDQEDAVRLKTEYFSKLGIEAPCGIENFDIFLFKIPHDAILSITFGNAIEDKNAEKIKSIVSGRKVTLKQAIK